MDKADYKSPKIKEITLTSHNVLCASEGNKTEGFTVSDHSYDESDWE